MSAPSKTPTQEAPAEKEPKINVPRALFFQLADAIEHAVKDSRRNDRVLHDATRDMCTDANDAFAAWAKARARGGAR